MWSSRDVEQQSLSRISAAAGWLHQANIGWEQSCPFFQEQWQCLLSQPRAWVRLLSSGFKEQGSSTDCFKMSLVEKSSLSCWLLQRNFLQASNLSLVQTVNLLSSRLLRSWIYTFLESIALETHSVHKKLAQVAFCFTFLLQFSEEILTKQFTIFRALMAVKLRQKRDLLLHWQNVSGRNQLWLVLHVISQKNHMQVFNIDQNSISHWFFAVLDLGQNKKFFLGVF